MYNAFFGFRERPFQLTPDPRFLFLNPGHREALATLRYGLSLSSGITLLLGEAGTGKTTLLGAALRAERRQAHRYVVLSNPTLRPMEFFEILAEALALPHSSGSKGQFLLAFERDLRERHGAGGLTALVVDEAQSLTHELFEEIRLLANLETATAKLVNVVLVGQPELRDRLNDPSLRQFKQRIVLRCSLAPLDLEWTASYIAARLRVAGAEAGDVFTQDAVSTIYEASRGIPRTIGVVCENALLAGYAAQKKPVDGSIVADVCRDFDLPVNGRTHRDDGAVPDRRIPDARRPRPATIEESSEHGSAAPVLADRTRIFGFF
jgi:general secretion pathway protein A